MPISQRENLVRIKALNPNSIVQIWTLSSILNEEMKKYFTDNQFNLAEIETLLDPIKYPKTFEMATELQRAKTLWAALADILKFLTLARILDLAGSAKRYYMEADNQYPENLNLQAKQREFMHQYAENTLGYKEVVYVDSYYINLETPIGKNIQDNAMQHLERLLADPTINDALKRIIESDRKLGFSLENIVIETFGRIPSILCKGLFESLNLDFRQFAEPKLAYQTYERRSWVSSNANKKISENSLEGRSVKESVQGANILSGYLERITKTRSYWKKNPQSQEESEYQVTQFSKKSKLGC
jgi:hypothetical protein